jgi:4-amino-4-deoxy-L-arabinose transferase-like glycosyltransferase
MYCYKVGKMEVIAVLKKKLKKADKKELAFLVLIFLVAAFLRLYRLGDLYSFLGDQGRDVLIVRDILLFKNFPFVGPTTSVGNFYLGPFYYYFIAPSLLLSWFDPIGPAIFVSLLGIFTCLILYYFLKSFISHRVAVISTIFYCLSPVIVQQTRFSWNPNPVPLFLLLAFFLILKWVKLKKDKYFYWAIVCLAVLWQLHYITLVLLPVIAVFLLFRKQLLSVGRLVKAGLILIISSFPLILFDIRHGFVNLKGLWLFVVQSVGGSDNRGRFFSRFLSYSWDRWRIIHKEFFGLVDGSIIHKLIILFGFVGVAVLIARYKKNKDGFSLLMLLWGFFGTLFLSFYQGSLHVYYLLSLLPLVPILISVAADLLILKWSLLGGMVAGVVVFLLGINMMSQNYHYLTRVGNLNIKAIKEVVEYIGIESGGNEFNFALLAEHNYDSSYRYFFDIFSMPAEYTDKVTDQLFVVCEELDKCLPEGNPKWEIAVFDAYYGGKIVKVSEKQIRGTVKVFRFLGISSE